MKKIIFPIVLILLLILSVCAYSHDVGADLENSIIRLHILARSDSDEDQSVKLAVRDRVLEAVKDITASDAEIFRRAAEDAANAYLSENGIPYRARAEYGLFDFPSKQYENITLPAGRYMGVRVLLGSGEGRNWWCIMYPPLCVSGGSAYADERARAELKARLNPDTYEVITSDGGKNRIGFRILDFINSFNK